MKHIPVLKKEVLEYLNPKPDENFIDCTIGQAGHTLSILEKTAPQGKVLGIDLDPQQIKKSRIILTDFKDRVILINNSYANLKDIVEKEKFNKVDGILADLGMSSEQLENSGRGFTFLKTEPLDMRYGNTELTAEKIVNQYPLLELEKIIEEYGQEKFAKNIAKKIIESRKQGQIKTTSQLVEIIKQAVPGFYRHGGINCATRTFQALRIAINGELTNLEKFLPQALQVLAENGRLAIISFHSLEDRVVKNFFKESEKQNLIKILTKKPIIAEAGEVKENPRSRSAKLRVIVRI